ncbi:hypothetical protein ACFOWB_25140 [Chenggangzhangella methanolivorans]|uniref:hypothetical protein n=1 Tax=Chenggangzhangella methanolivorans TaxID=1437009 RepID=UPI0036099D40
MGLIGTLAYLPVTAGLRDARDDIRSNAKDALSVEGFKDFKATYENNRIVYRQDVEAKIAAGAADLRALEARIRKDSKAIVPRGEHEEHWRSQNAQIINLQRQVDEVKAQAGSTYGVRDVIQRLEKQVEDLREEKYRAMSRGGP